MSRKYFGTDGVRGKVGDAPITPEFVIRLGFAAGEVLVQRSTMPQGGHPAVLIGKDTRVSGYMLEASLEAGFSAAGVDVMLTGPLPTPAIAYLTRALRLLIDDPELRRRLGDVAAEHARRRFDPTANARAACCRFLDIVGNIILAETFPPRHAR